MANKKQPNYSDLGQSAVKKPPNRPFSYSLGQADVKMGSWDETERIASNNLDVKSMVSMLNKGDMSAGWLSKRINSGAERILDSPRITAVAALAKFKHDKKQKKRTMGGKKMKKVNKAGGGMTGVGLYPAEMARAGTMSQAKRKRYMKKGGGITYKMSGGQVVSHGYDK